jgi:GNAT acetyltransferase-like protein
LNTILVRYRRRLNFSIKHMSTKLATQPVYEVLQDAAHPREKQSIQKVSKEIACRVLERADYAEWNNLIDRSPHGTIFHYSWWLQTTAADFKILAIRNERGAIVAGMPVPRERRPGLTLLCSPSLTPYLGPVFDLSCIESTCDRLHFMRSHGEVLARNLKSFDSVRYVAGASAPDLQGFLWAGFRVHLAYTFRFPATHTLDQVAAGMTRTHHQKLTKAMRLNLRVIRDDGLEDLISLNRMTFEKQGLKPGCSSDFLTRLWNVAYEQKRGHLYIARNSDDKPVAALLTVHDNRTTYQIVSGVNPEFREIPGAYLVLWNALQDSLLAGRDYDFEGSSLRGVECFYRRWGASAVPIWRLEKSGSWRGGLFQSLVDRRDLLAVNR